MIDISCVASQYTMMIWIFLSENVQVLLTGDTPQGGISVPPRKEFKRGNDMDTLAF